MSWVQEGRGVGKDPQRLEGPAGRARWRSLPNWIASRSEENMRDGQTNKTREQMRQDGVVCKCRLMQLKFSKLQGELEVTKQTLIWPSLEGESGVGGGLWPDV